jgi:hypothetical protein
MQRKDEEVQRGNILEITKECYIFQGWYHFHVPSYFVFMASFKHVRTEERRQYVLFHIYKYAIPAAQIQFYLRAENSYLR